MTEHLFQMIVVWTLLVGSIAQTVFHLTTWWAIGPQPEDDPIGIALRRREASLGLKGAIRVFFDIMLVFLVMGDGLPFTELIRNGIYTTMTLATAAALWFGWRFIEALRADNWGRPKRGAPDS